jgi:hypothetical protein
MPSNPDLKGIAQQLQTHTTKFDSILLKVGGFNEFGGAAFLPYENLCVSFREISVFDTDTAGLRYALPDTGTKEFTIGLDNSEASQIRRIIVRLQCPPICNVITNAQFALGALDTTATAISAVALGATLSGTFVDGAEVTISSGVGGGSNFTGTVAGVTGGAPDAITVVNGGTGYADATGVLTDGTATINITGATLGTGLLNFPNPTGRLIVPVNDHNGIVYNSTQNHAVYADRYNFSNSIAAERFNSNLTKNITGYSTSGAEAVVQRMRASGLATHDTAAHYQQYVVAAAIKSFCLMSGDANLGEPMDGVAIKYYNEHFASEINRFPPRRTQGFKQPYDLKCNSMCNGDFLAVLPFACCHDAKAALNIGAGKSQSLQLKLELNGWKSLLVNSPTYNDDLTLSSANTATTTVPSGADFPAATYASAITTYTVPTGRIDAATDVSMLTTNSSNQCICPSTPLTRSMFSVSVLVEYVFYQSKATKNKFETGTQVLHWPIFKPYALASSNFTSSSTAVQQPMTLHMKGNVTHMFLVNQLNSSKLQNRTLDFSCSPDPILHAISSSTTGLGGAYGGHTNHFFDWVELQLNDERRILATSKDMAELFPQAVTTRTPACNSGLYMINFSGANPFDQQQTGSLSCNGTSATNNTISFKINKGILTDQRYIGGLSSETFSTKLYVMQQQLLTMNGTTGTFTVRKN